MSQIKFSLVTLLAVTAAFNLTACGNSQPIIEIVDVQANEANVDTKSITIPVKLSVAAKEKVTVQYQTKQITAKAGQDYIDKQGLLTFSPGKIEASIVVDIVGDIQYESDEDFAIVLTNPINARLKGDGEDPGNIIIVSIINDDTKVQAGFLSSFKTVVESSRIIKVDVALSSISGQDTKIPFDVSGTAEKDRDYVLSNDDSVVIPAGQSIGTLEIFLKDDNQHECTKTLFIKLRHAKFASTKQLDSFELSIEDNDYTGDLVKVGPKQTYTLPSQAAIAVKSGDTVEITQGEYKGDVAVWKQNNLALCGTGQGVVLRAAGQSAQSKGTWVIQGNNVLVENIHFYDAKVSDKNGAGIRSEGNNLTVRHCKFEKNENGLLAGALKESEILVEHSEFDRNGAGDGQSHNIYIGQVKKFTAQFNTFKHANIGHNIKSRAKENVIQYNRIMDGKDGRASYQVDLPAGGVAYLIGNVIQQGQEAENWAMVAFGAEGLKYQKNELYMINNTLVNDRSSGIFVKTVDNSKAILINNIFAGKGDKLKLVGEMKANLIDEKMKFVSRQNYDYRLVPRSAAINTGVPLESYNGFNVTPIYEYGKENKKRIRKVDGKLDLGACEYSE